MQAADQDKRAQADWKQEVVTKGKGKKGQVATDADEDEVLGEVLGSEEETGSEDDDSEAHSSQS